MPNILNLTVHPASESQAAAGVIEPNEEDKGLIKELSNFADIPSVSEIASRADQLSDIAEKYGCDQIMITGAPYLMSALETSLESKGMEPVYSFSERVSVDYQKPDGSMGKRSEFEHLGFVEPQGIKIEDSPEKVNVTKDGVLNLTQHAATDGQIEAGVHEPSDKGAVKEALTFRGAATADDIKQKANALADIAKNEGYGKVMIGGAGYLMKPLETALSARGIEPTYAFSVKAVTSTIGKDGKTINDSTFVHKGFVEVEPAKPEPIEKLDPRIEAAVSSDKGGYLSERSAVISNIEKSGPYFEIGSAESMGKYSDVMMQDPEVAKAWVENNPYGSLKDFSGPAAHDPQAIDKSISNDGRNLQYVPQDERTKERCLNAIENDEGAVQYTPKEYLEDKEFCKDAVSRNPDAYDHLPDDMKADADIKEAAGVDEEMDKQFDQIAEEGAKEFGNPAAEEEDKTGSEEGQDTAVKEEKDGAAKDEGDKTDQGTEAKGKDGPDDIENPDRWRVD